MQQSVKVIILLTESLSLFEYGCATELFALPRDEFPVWYTTETVSLTDTHYAGLSGESLMCRRVSALPPCDLLVVPSFRASVVDVPDIYLRELQQHHARGGRTISFCSGSFLLAAAGLLDNRVATTHWRYASALKAQFPYIQFRDDILYHYDGQVGCSAGSAAGIDLGIEVIRCDFGHEAANNVARRLVLPAHRSGGQSQFVAKPVSAGNTSLSKSLEWAVRNLSHTLTISDIAAKANMTRRTFDRQFKRSFRMTPGMWLTQRKLEMARQLLESTQLPVETVAMRAGFENAASLRISFKKHISVSPGTYRMQFGRYPAAEQHAAASVDTNSALSG
ncbi:helix-turn-helix domain-containing protein [Alteromonas sp. NFXS44]|uniref:helix-turn-helix domain-containing protein n=1 Tax=Alteromonas sp. NFXS44 TaxID=2818435 RepID=UPI0032DE9708